MNDPNEELDEGVALEWADESIDPDDAGDELACAEWPDEEGAEAEAVELEQVARDGFERGRLFLPQPERARSNPDLPRVKANAFKRFLA